MKEYIIQGKGFFNEMVKDPYFGDVEICDIKSSYGCINFKGTDKQLDKFLEYLYQDESYFKVIGVFDAIDNE